jgi:membrane-associated protease RseP (regulator of RpoE activity)
MAMKKLMLFIVTAGGCLVLFSGCASNKITHERGWVGGKYLESDTSFVKKTCGNYFESKGRVIPVLPDEIKKNQSGAVFVSRVFDNTPLMNAGIKEGDLIVAIDNQPVESLAAFRKLVDHGKPGEKISFAVFRNGETKEIPVVVGRETYQKWGYFTLGFGFGTEFDPVPHPDFNLLGLISYKRNDTRLELNSPEYRYFRQAKALPPDKSDRNPGSEADAEGWAAWFVIFGFSGKKIILEQTAD